jgi:hypothetical protein
MTILTLNVTAVSRPRLRTISYSLADFPGKLYRKHGVNQILANGLLLPYQLKLCWRVTVFPFTARTRLTRRGCALLTYRLGTGIIFNNAHARHPSRHLFHQSMRTMDEVLYVTAPSIYRLAARRTGGDRGHPTTRDHHRRFSYTDLLQL